MTIEIKDLQNTTTPAITYSECYAQPFLLFNESNLDTMTKMPDCFVDLTVTSPPYDDLRTYNGYSFPFEDIAKELYRVTKQGGVVVWVVSDQTKKGTESGTSFKQALYFKEIGFNLHDTMIYLKTSYMPNVFMKRYNNAFDYMFIFSKGIIANFNPIMENKLSLHKRTAKEHLSFREINGSRKHKNIDPQPKVKKTNVWKILNGYENTKDKFIFKHPATFPEQLANDHIISWSNEGDIVYDPFAGSGTTGKMAILNKRKCIMSEISAEYCEIIKQRLEPIINERTLF